MDGAPVTVATKVACLLRSALLDRLVAAVDASAFTGDGVRAEAEAVGAPGGFGAMIAARIGVPVETICRVIGVPTWTRAVVRIAIEPLFVSRMN